MYYTKDSLGLCVSTDHLTLILFLLNSFSPIYDSSVLILVSSLSHLPHTEHPILSASPSSANVLEDFY